MERTKTMFKVNKKMFATAMVMLVFVGTMSLSAFAGTSFTSYNTVVGKVNGNGYSANQTKSTSGANGRIISTSVGGNYLVDVRMQKSDGTASGDWYNNLTDNMDTGYNVDGDVGQTAGSNVRLHFSNKLTTPVDVQVIGSWCSQ